MTLKKPEKNRTAHLICVCCQFKCTSKLNLCVNINGDFDFGDPSSEQDNRAVKRLRMCERINE